MCEGYEGASAKARTPRGHLSSGGAARRRGLVAGLAALAGLALAACAQTGTAPPPSAAAGLSGEVIGDEGGRRVVLLAPLDGETGASIRNAAELAYRDSRAQGLEIVVKDSGGTGEGARAAASEALAEGADLILGPLFAQEVAAVGTLARQAGVPVVAFSTDPNVAARGVYLLSFQVASEVDRVVEYARQQGRRSIAALVPESTYGAIAEAAFQEAAARHGVSVATIQRYGSQGGALERAAGAVAAEGERIDAVFLPTSGEALAAAIAALEAGGLDTGRARLLGTGVWNGPDSLGIERLSGAWFAGPAPEGFDWFEGRYRQSFEGEPVRIASLAYDAVRLAAELAPEGYSEASLTDPNGFAGVDGIFRFRRDGTGERGLAVLEVGAGSARVISPAPRSFLQEVAGR